jgi:O-acetyl-ADP-ribose deacetylase (regulator of RNase III)
MPLKIVNADITTLQVDAIVNAANPSLLGGGGVDGAIHRAAGTALLEACRRLPQSTPGVRCPAGEARITPGFALPARYVIHAVGPVWHGGGQGEPLLLERCHRNALRLLREHGLRTIALPAISCGVYGYPINQAAAVAVAALRDELELAPSLDITVCCFSDGTRVTFQRALDDAMPGADPPFNGA